MIAHKRVLKTIAKNHRLDPDDILIALWYLPGERFDYLKNENDFVKNKDLVLVKAAVDRILRARTNIEMPEPKAAKPVVIEYREHDFGAIGHQMIPGLYLTKDEIVTIYEELVSDFESFDDPIVPSGVKTDSLLESAAFHPRTSYEGTLKYPTIETAAAALMYALSHNHAFFNGNKRAAMVSMLVFLDRQNICLTCDEDDLFRISLKLADHKLVSEREQYPDAEIEKLARWIRENSKLIKKGERPITMKRLKQTLASFGCEVLDSGRVIRTIPRKPTFLNSAKELTISSKRPISVYQSDGREIDMGFVHSLREELQLDPDHGVDSDYFYEMIPVTPGEFIHKYQNLLKRLARR
jgi:death-on-curing family protein